MSKDRFKTYPISKDPDFKYKSSVHTNIAATIRKEKARLYAEQVAREFERPEVQVVEVDHVQDAKAPHNVSQLFFKRGMGK